MYKTQLLVITLLTLQQIKCVPKLHVEVFYESLCPDSFDFITKQLYPVYNELAPYIDLELIPFGKSISVESPEAGLQFICQHGPQECTGNKIQSCVLNSLTDQSKRVEYVNCFMKTFRRERQELGQKCAEAVDIDFNQVAGCYSSPLGSNLQLAAEKRTAEISPQFVPTIVYNKKFDQHLQDDSFVDFRSVVCSILRQTHPEACKAPSIIRLD